MDVTGEYRFDATVEPVWTLLMDTDAIAQCVPGCRALRPIGDDRYQAELVVAVAAVTGTYDATIAIEHKQPPNSYTIVVDANGRLGFLRGRAVVTLSADQEGTIVRVHASGDVGGTVARVGQRLLQSAGRAMIDRFFTCLQRRLAPDATA